MCQFLLPDSFILFDDNTLCFTFMFLPAYWFPGLVSTSVSTFEYHNRPIWVPVCALLSKVESIGVRHRLVRLVKLYFTFIRLNYSLYRIKRSPCTRHYFKWCTWIVMLLWPWPLPTAACGVIAYRSSGSRPVYLITFVCRDYTVLYVMSKVYK